MGLASKITWAAAAAAIAVVVNKVKDLILVTADYADQINDTAEKWGFTTKQIQEFDYWATLNGTTLESLLTGMRGLVNQAEAGSSAFAKLGVAVKNADGTFKDQRTLFLETLTALQGVENQTERNALQFEIFGRAGIELGQVINQDAATLEALSQEAENLGIILSEKTLTSAGALNDELDKLKRQGKSALAEFIAGAEGSSEKLDAFLDNLTDKIAEYSPKFVAIAVQLLAKLVKAFAQTIPELIPTIFNAILEVDWLQLGIDIGWSIVKGIGKSIVNGLGSLIGYGWLWGKDEKPRNVAEIDVAASEAITTINNVGATEKTETINETLDITLSVESDGTIASEKNLDAVSDLLLQKINKALGDEIDG